MAEQQHPIEGLMKTAMESIKEMVDVNTIVGDPVETPDGNVIIPISRVACGFAAGGGEFEAGGNGENEQSIPGFGGGSGAGVSVQPVGFLVVGQGQVRLLPVDGNALYDRIIDMAPQIINQIQTMLERLKGNKQQNQQTVSAQPQSMPPVQ
ncbi:sporulation protein YtfJ [Desulfofarcimen acetoxidans DSM 771]|uniref:Sporulation protein YtfJ n=1 Tax=Desulfofarcimen acetoxidans (strain ATCC 49208 / DSM 771 / KCTC 5769 / VKM B-1644 / 5575) TaxID=485916 RepID=C8VZ11_DESAS|nr:GerW family sporulation protein [Desulfofarcimen acetoxidans]ACV62921.1 sporulation protein YtfJ [Desulfofarcimen acetoxidans DSM 771]